MTNVLWLKPRDRAGAVGQDARAGVGAKERPLSQVKTVNPAGRVRGRAGWAVGGDPRGLLGLVCLTAVSQQPDPQDPRRLFRQTSEQHRCLQAPGSVRSGPGSDSATEANGSATAETRRRDTSSTPAPGPSPRAAHSWALPPIFALYAMPTMQ